MNCQSQFSKIDEAIQKNNNVCSQCLNESDLDDGDYSVCCDSIVLSAIQMKRALRGKIPRVNLGFQDKGEKPIRKEVNKRDAESGIRTGTMKHRAYQLWKKGFEYKGAAKKLKANESSVRSWFGRFKLKWGER